MTCSFSNKKSGDLLQYQAAFTEKHAHNKRWPEKALILFESTTSYAYTISINSGFYNFQDSHHKMGFGTLMYVGYL